MALRLIPGKVYNFFGKNGIEEVKRNGLPLGQVVSYGDMANPRTEYVVIETEGTANGQFCINRETFGQTTVSITAIESPGGWQQKEEIAPLEEIEFLKEANQKMLPDQHEKEQSARQAREEAIDKGKPLIPSWAKSVIIAEHHENISDSYSDYFDSRVNRRIILAFSTHEKDLFKEMRQAAAKLTETEHLGPGKDEYRVAVVLDSPESVLCGGRYEYKGNLSHHHYEEDGFTQKTFTTLAEAETYIANAPTPYDCTFDNDVVASFKWSIRTESVEHREKWSMGKGYYLQAGSTYSGWRVRKSSIDSETCFLLGIGAYVDSLFAKKHMR